MVEWKTIFEYPDYEVSDEGRVRDYEQNILQIIEEDGYSLVPIDGRLERVDQLVAEAFLPSLQEHITGVSESLQRAYGHGVARQFEAKVKSHCNFLGCNPTVNELRTIAHVVTRRR